MLKGTKLRVIKSKYFRAYQDRYSARDTYNLTQEFLIIKVKVRKERAMCQIFTKLNLFNVKKKKLSVILRMQFPLFGLKYIFDEMMPVMMAASWKKSSLSLLCD